MAEEQQFCLRWNNFQVNITSQFEALRDDEDFVDVTLACEGKRLKAHKVVLSACSPYFKDLFKSNPCKHPILFMRDVEFHHLQALVEFMYAGEVNIAQAQLSAFLRTAESLQIRGLTEAPQRHKQIDGFSNVASQARAGSGSTSRRVGSPGGGSRTSSPEDGEQEGAEEEVMSLSPPGSPPAKRACRTGEKVNPLEALDDSGSVSSQQRAPHPEQYESIKCESIDIVEPKVEVPDYCSDGEGRVDNTGVSGMYPGMDNSVDAPPAFPGLQASGMVMLPGTSSQGYMGEASQDSGQGFGRVRRGRPRFADIISRPSGYDIQPLNLSGFSVRNGLVSLGEGVQVTEDQLRKINWGDYRKLTRGLAAVLFSPLELATCSVTGQRWSRAGLHDGRPCKPALDKNKVRAILAYVAGRFPEIEVSKIKQVLAYKCKESASSLKIRLGSVS